MHADPGLQHLTLQSLILGTLCLTGEENFEMTIKIQEGTSGKFPPLLLTLEKLPCIITLSLKRSQSQKKTNIFHAADLSICPKLECPSPTSGGDTYIKEQPSVSEVTF